MESPPGSGRIGGQLTGIGEEGGDVLRAPFPVGGKAGFGSRGNFGQAVGLVFHAVDHGLIVGRHLVTALVRTAEMVRGRDRAGGESAGNRRTDQAATDGGGKLA